MKDKMTSIVIKRIVNIIAIAKENLDNNNQIIFSICADINVIYFRLNCPNAYFISGDSLELTFTSADIAALIIDSIVDADAFKSSLVLVRLFIAPAASSLNPNLMLSNFIFQLSY